MSMLYFWVNGAGTVVKYNRSNVAAVIGGGQPLSHFHIDGCVFFYMQRKDNEGLFDLWSS